MKKYVVVDDIYDSNGLLLAAKGMEISTEKLVKLKRLGLEEKAIEQVVSEKKVPVNDPEVKNTTKFGLDNTIDEFMACLDLFAEKVKGIDLKDFNYCSDLLTELLFDRKANWRMPLIALANYADWVYTHSINVAILSLMIGKALGYKERDLHILGLSAILHDVGYLLIPKSLMFESNHFNDIVQQHCELGKALLDDFPVKEVCKDVVLQHHERLDGSGYPNGLESEEINPYTKIVMVADAFDSMTTERPYGKTMSQEIAVKKLQSMVAKYDRSVVSIFIDILNPSKFH